MNEDPLLKLFTPNYALLTDELGLIEKRAFCNKIKNILNYAEDPHYFFNDQTNYYMNIIKLEIWLQLVDKGRDYFIQSLKTSRVTKDYLHNIELINWK